MSAELLADSLALIQERGVIRCAAIAELLGYTSANVQHTLKPLVDKGELVACSVEVGGEKLVEYRYSAAAGSGKTPGFRPYRSPLDLKKAPTPVRESAPLPARTEQPEEDKQMSAKTEKILSAFEKHGPMTVAQLRDHIDVQNLAPSIIGLRDSGKLKRLGGGERSSIYGLPGQKAPAAGDGVDMDAATPRAKKPKKAAGGGMPRKQRKPSDIPLVRGLSAERRIEEKIGRRLGAARQVAGAFRPAIAHDGALLLTGAAQQGELNSAETRVLADFLARVDRTGVRA